MTSREKSFQKLLYIIDFRKQIGVYAVLINFFPMLSHAHRKIGNDNNNTRFYLETLCGNEANPMAEKRETFPPLEFYLHDHESHSKS